MPFRGRDGGVLLQPALSFPVSNQILLSYARGHFQVEASSISFLLRFFVSSSLCVPHA